MPLAGPTPIATGTTSRSRVSDRTCSSVGLTGRSIDGMGEFQTDWTRYLTAGRSREIDWGSGPGDSVRSTRIWRSDQRFEGLLEIQGGHLKFDAGKSRIASGRSEHSPTAWNQQPNHRRRCLADCVRGSGR